MEQESILISGIGIAGSYWLGKHDYRPTLIEQAPRLRTGGYVIDFWGRGFDIAARMGLLSDLKSEGYNAKEVRLVDAEGHRVGGFDVDVFRALTHDRYVSIPRGDESREGILQPKFDAVGWDVCRSLPLSMVAPSSTSNNVSQITDGHLDAWTVCAGRRCCFSALHCWPVKVPRSPWPPPMCWLEIADHYRSAEHGFRRYQDLYHRLKAGVRHKTCRIIFTENGIRLVLRNQITKLLQFPVVAKLTAGRSLLDWYRPT